MDFDLNDEQKEIKQVAHELLASRSPFSKVREAATSAKYDPALWSELVELGCHVRNRSHHTPRFGRCALTGAVSHLANHSSASD